MFITLNKSGKVVAYSDNMRNPNCLKKGEKQIEIDAEYMHLSCVKGGLVFEDGKLLNSGELVGEAINTD